MFVWLQEWCYHGCSKGSLLLQSVISLSSFATPEVFWQTYVPMYHLQWCHHCTYIHEERKQLILTGHGCDRRPRPPAIPMGWGVVSLVVLQGPLPQGLVWTHINDTHSKVVWPPASQVKCLLYATRLSGHTTVWSWTTHIDDTHSQLMDTHTQDT